MCRVLSFPQSRIWVRLCKTWQTVELQISCVEVMDVPNKWGLSEFLELADTVIKRYDLSRTDGFKQPPAMSRFGLSYTVCAFRKGPRVADSLLPHFQMPLGNAPRVRVLESIAAGAITPNRVCGRLGVLVFECTTELFSSET